MTEPREHLDNQICWCGDDHTYLDLRVVFSHPA
jgi:hypothetical protein